MRQAQQKLNDEVAPIMLSIDFQNNPSVLMVTCDKKYAICLAPFDILEYWYGFAVRFPFGRNFKKEANNRKGRGTCVERTASGGGGTVHVGYLSS